MCSPRILLTSLILHLLILVPNVSQAQAPAGSVTPDVPSKYQRFFYHYSPIRSIPATALSQAGLDSARVGRSFALVAGISRYPNLQPVYRDLTAASEDVKKLADYLTNVEFFDEVVVLQNDDVTYDNFSFFLQAYFPEKFKTDSNARLLVAYSGHGFSRGRSSYLVTSSASRLDPKNPDMAAALNLYNIRQLIQDDREFAHTAIALLNTCNSGDFLNRPFGSSSISIYDKSAYAITAGTDQQLAWSYPTVGSGSLFFEKFFAALDGRANVLYRNASIDVLGVVTVDELYSYLLDQIQKTTASKQTPKMGDLDENGSTGLFYFLDRSKLVSGSVRPAWDEDASPNIPPAVLVPAGPTVAGAALNTTSQSLAFAQSVVASATSASFGEALQEPATKASVAGAEPRFQVKNEWVSQPSEGITAGQVHALSKNARTPQFTHTIETASPPVTAWPPEALEGGTYVVSPDDAEMTIDYLRLPDKFTLLFDPSIKEVVWRVHKLEFGKGATIDASAPQTPIPPAPPGIDGLVQPIPGATGRSGGPGAQGAAGLDGIRLFLQVDTLVPRGNLWIRTDGAEGAAGGRGGNGQIGGNATCRNLGMSHEQGGQGGTGGPGGKGGSGGATGHVQLSILGVEGKAANDMRPYSTSQSCSTECGRSTRPEDLLSDDGEIRVYGKPGCGGPGGFGGAPGPGGDEGEKRTCAVLGLLYTGHAVGGELGTAGPRGPSGPSGHCTDNPD